MEAICIQQVYHLCGGTVALWLVRFTLDQVVWVQAPARVIVLCS